MGDRQPEPDLPAHRGGGRDLSRRPVPQRLPGLVDSHAHLQHHRFEPDRDAVIWRASKAGIDRILVPGWDVPSSEAALELADRHRDVIDAAVGVHPHDAAAMDEAGWARLESLAADPRTRAIGEIGLDFHRNLSSPDVQREAFARQLPLAASRNLPVVIHDREAHDEISGALLGAGVRGVLHAFSGDGAMAARLHAAGFVISFALPVAFRSATGPREAARRLPDGAFLVETDAPYLGPDRELRNEPTTTLRIVAELARLRKVGADALVGGIREAYRSLFGT